MGRSLRKFQTSLVIISLCKLPDQTPSSSSCCLLLFETAKKGRGTALIRCAWLCSDYLKMSELHLEACSRMWQEESDDNSINSCLTDLHRFACFQRFSTPWVFQNTRSIDTADSLQMHIAQYTMACCSTILCSCMCSHNLLCIIDVHSIELCFTSLWKKMIVGCML